MPPIAKRAGAIVSAVLGLALVVGGVWLALRVGPSGTLTLSGKPTADATVVLTPQVLNRIDSDTTVTVTPAPGATVWMGVASPSDADAIVGTSPVIRTVGANGVRGTLTLASFGSGQKVAPLAGADIWRATATGSGPTVLTLTQERAPESVVVRTDKGKVAQVRVTVEHKAWFVEAILGGVVGLVLTGVAAFLAHSAWPGLGREVLGHLLRIAGMLRRRAS